MRIIYSLILIAFSTITNAQQWDWAESFPINGSNFNHSILKALNGNFYLTENSYSGANGNYFKVKLIDGNT